MNVRLNSITTSRRWFTPRQRIETMPTLGFDLDSRVSRISLSAQSVSPTKTGFGSLMSVQARFAAAFSLVSGTVSPVTSASVKALLTSGRPKRVRSAYGVVEVHLVRVHRQTGEPDVVGFRDRPPEAAPEDVSGLEVLVEAAAPELRGRGLLGWHASAPFVPWHVYMSDIREGVKPTASTPLDTRLEVRHKRKPGRSATRGGRVKAVRFHEFGGADVLRVEEVADPSPARAQVAARHRRLAR